MFVTIDHMQPPISFEYTDGAGLIHDEKYGFYLPFCLLECTPENIETGSCVMCSMVAPHLEVLAPDVEYTTSWNGQSYTTNTMIFGCQCSNKIAKAFPGTVMAEVCVYREFECLEWASDEECSLEEGNASLAQGIGIHAEGVGVPECFQSTFDIPTSDTEVEILITSSDTAQDTAQDTALDTDPDTSPDSNGIDSE